MKVQEYIKDDGSNPYQKWFDSLDVQAAVKVTVAIARLKAGNTHWSQVKEIRKRSRDFQNRVKLRQSKQLKDFIFL